MFVPDVIELTSIFFLSICRNPLSSSAALSRTQSLSKEGVLSRRVEFCTEFCI